MRHASPLRRSHPRRALHLASVLVALVALAALGALAACFNPTYPDNLPCDPDGWCPPGQTCNVVNLCVIDDNVGMGDARPPDGPPAPYPVAIDLGPDLGLTVGDTQQFTVTQIYSDGARVTVADNELVIWRSADNGVVWFDNAGLATAQSVGVVTVTARYQGLADAVEITVVAP